MFAKGRDNTRRFKMFNLVFAMGNQRIRNRRWLAGNGFLQRPIRRFGESMRSDSTLRVEQSVTSLVYKHAFLIPWLRGMNRFITSPMPRFPLVKMAADTLVW